MSAIQYTGREVIENKLMLALESGSQVAALFTKDDLDLIRFALGYYCANASEAPDHYRSKAQGMCEDLEKLRKSAFR